MTKSIEEQALDAAQFCKCRGSVCHGCEPIIKDTFIKGAKARDAQWSAVVNIFKSQDRLKGYPTGIEWQQLITKADQMLKEMNLK